MTEFKKRVEINLAFPVQLADRKLEKVTMRRPVMRDIIKHNINDNSGIQESVNLIADLCGLVPDELELFDVADYDVLQNQLLSFRKMGKP